MKLSPTTPSIIINTVAFLFLALSVSFKGSYALSGALIVLSYSLFLLSSVRASVALSGLERGLLAVMAIYFGALVVEVSFYGIAPRELDGVSKILLFMPLVFLLSAIKLNTYIVSLGFACGCLGVFLLTMYEVFILESLRVGLTINAIQLGNIALALSLMALLLLPFFRRCQPSLLSLILYLSAILLGVVTALLTQTRGGLVALPVLMVLAGWHFRSSLKQHLKWISLLLASLVVAAVLALPNSALVERFDRGWVNLENYWQTGDASTSVGVRLELWKAALIIAQEDVLLGVGKPQYLQRKAELIEQGRLSPTVLRYGHSHNIYFYSLVRRGLVGLAIVMAFLLLPIYVGVRKAKTAQGRTIGFALLIYGIFFMAANFTQVLFSHNSGIVMYTGMLIILVSLYCQAEREQAPALASS